MVDNTALPRYSGFAFAILSGILYTLANSFFKLIEMFSYSEVLMMRGVVHLFLIIPVLLVFRNDIRGSLGTRVILWSGSSVSALCLVLAFMAFRILPFGEVMAILFCNPVIIMLLSYVFLKEPCGLYKVFAVILLLIGLTFIAKPPELIKLLSFKNITDQYEHSENISEKDQIFGNISSANKNVADNSSKDKDVYLISNRVEKENNLFKISAKDERATNTSAKIEVESISELGAWPYGYIIASCSTIALSFSIFAQKQVSDRTHYSIIIFSFAICNILVGFVGILIESSPHGVPDDWNDIVYALLYGVASLVGQLFFILSLQILPASVVSMVRSLEIVFAFMVQIFWFQEPYHWASFVGSAAVMISVILITQESIVMKAVSNCCTEKTMNSKI